MNKILNPKHVQNRLSENVSNPISFSTTDETVFIGTTQSRPLVKVNEFGTWRYKLESTCQFLLTFISILKSNHCGLRICVYPKLGGLQDETDYSCRTVHRSFWTAETVKRSISQPSYWPRSSINQGGHQGLPSHSVRLFFGKLTKIASFQT